MNNLQLIFCSLLLICISHFGLSAQERYTIYLKEGNLVPAENFTDFLNTAQVADAEVFDGYYYRMVQFYEMPTRQVHLELKSSGLVLLEYLPHDTYLVAIPADLSMSVLAPFEIRSVVPIPESLKIDRQLLDADQLEDWAKKQGQIRAMLQFFSHIQPERAMAAIRAENLPIVKSNGYNSVVETLIPAEEAARIANLPFVAHLGMVPAPDVKDDTEGQSLHRSSAIDTRIAGGRQYDGRGVNVLIRDDGQVGPHIDYHGRLVQDLASHPLAGTHGDGVGGIMAGAGNLDPTKRGMAAGAGVYVLDYDASFLDNTMSYFFNENVSVTNSSYSNGCNFGYTTTTRTVEEQLFNNPTLMHVFSAGNSNNNDCGYGAGDQWGNVTGGHKQAKNCLTVANVFADGSIVNSSSRGPAHDGRIKPDISANGQDQFSTDPNNTYDPFGGTSGAAPGVAGVFAQLKGAYMELNGGAEPPSALIKACMLNGANDLGNPGPDFTFGWGLVNGLRSARMLEENRYAEMSVGQNETATMTIAVPENTAQVKVMVYWPDFMGFVGSGFALINDLDMTVNYLGQEYLPWVLDHTPNQAALSAPAIRGEDHLNNMEQVTIDNPVAGDMELTVSGINVPFDDQVFYVSIDFISNDVELTYPVGGETMVPGERQNIHWDGVRTSQNPMLEYSTDGGNTWTAISGASGSNRMRTGWQVPSTVSGECKIRVTGANGVSSMNEVDFNIAPLSPTPVVESACPEGITLTWAEVPDAASYDVYVLGEKYMDVVGNSTTNSFLYETSNVDTAHYFSVHVNYNNGAVARRANAIGFEGGLFNCVQDNDLALQGVGLENSGYYLTCDNLDQLGITIRNNGSVPQSGFEVGYQVDSDPPVTETVSATVNPDESLEYAFANPPVLSAEQTYHLTMWTTISSDTYRTNDTLTREFALTVVDNTAQPLDYEQPFSTAFPPSDFQLYNPDQGLRWNATFAVQRDGTFGSVAVFRNYNYPLWLENPEPDVLVTPIIDLSAATDELLLFDLAYREDVLSGDFEVGFMVEVSTDCGETFTDVLFEEYGDQLANLAPSEDPFTPQDQYDWQRQYLDISAYYGQEVMFRFTNIGAVGNNLYLDNINVQSLDLAEPVAGFIASDDGLCRGDTLTFTNISMDGESFMWTFPFGLPSSSLTPGPHDVRFFGEGEVEVRLIVNNFLGADTFIMPLTISSLVNAGFNTTVASDGLTVTFQNSSSNATDYFWDFGDGNTSTAENPVHTYATSGTYAVTLYSTNAYCESTEAETLSLISTNIEMFEAEYQVRLAPNPANDHLQLFVGTDGQLQFDWQLTNLQGQQLDGGILNGNVRQEIDTAGLPSGVYFIKITDGTDYTVRRVVVMH